MCSHKNQSRVTRTKQRRIVYGTLGSRDLVGYKVYEQQVVQCQDCDKDLSAGSWKFINER